MVGSSINLSDLQSGSFTGYVGSKGVIGYTGSKGEFGGAAFEYNYSNTTSNADPGPGFLRFNSLDLSTATTLYLDFLDVASANCFNYLQTIDDSTSGVKGTFKIEDKANNQVYAFFSITGAHSHPTDYFQVPIAWINGVTSFTNNLDTVTTFVRTGDKGDIGYTGSQGVIGYTGSKGDIGYTGSKGTDGTIGYNGSNGYVGSQGYTGSKGDIGYTGSAGAASANTQVIYNDSGALVGNASLTFVFSSNTLNVNGAVNATSHSVGTSFTANATLVNAAAVNVTGQVNTATFYAATSANVGTVFTANTTALAASANLAMSNNYIVAPALKAYSEFVTTNAASTGATTLDLSASNFFNLTLTGNVTFTFSNSPSGRAFSFTIVAKQDATGGRTITYPAGSKYAGAVTPPATTTANAVDIWSVMTYDAGSTYIVSLAVKNAS
jgi:hypothetical protein